MGDDLFGCAECGNDFTAADAAAPVFEVRDSNGELLADGDSVIIIKDLKVKGMLKDIKKGTKVKSIRINPNGVNGHYIDAKVDGFGAMGLLGEVVKKG
jgi:protein PhnA